MLRITYTKMDGTYEHKTGDSFVIDWKTIDDECGCPVTEQCLMVDNEVIGAMSNIKTLFVTQRTHPRHHPEAPDGFSSSGRGARAHGE